MRDYRFGSKDGSKPSFYVFSSTPSNPSESSFYRYDTVQEACALFQYLQAEHPGESFSLGIHKDGTRRADIIKHVEGVTVLSDDYKRTSPWRDDPAVMAAAKEASDRLGATWKVDRELVGEPVLIPNEPKSRFLTQYYEGKSLCPDVPGKPCTSIQEAFVQGLGWMPLDGLRSVAKSNGYGNPEIPAVSHYQVAYRVDENGFRGTASITPSDFKIMEERYLTQQEKAKDAGCQPLDALKQEAKERALEKGQAYAGRQKVKDHAHSL